MINEYSDLLKSCVRYIGIRPRTKRETVKFLENKSNNTELNNNIISRLEQLKLIDDKAFLDWYTESRSRSSPRGYFLLKQELTSHGVDKDLIDSSYINEIEQLKLAVAAVTKKYKNWSTLNTQDDYPRIYRFLASRGFSPSTIEKVIKKRYNSEDVNK